MLQCGDTHAEVPAPPRVLNKAVSAHQAAPPREMVKLSRHAKAALPRPYSDCRQLKQQGTQAGLPRDSDRGVTEHMSCCITEHGAEITKYSYAEAGKPDPTGEKAALEQS